MIDEASAEQNSQNVLEDIVSPSKPLKNPKLPHSSNSTATPEEDSIYLFRKQWHHLLRTLWNGFLAF